MLDSATYQITLVHLDGRADLRLVGEFDLAAAPDLRDEVMRRVAGRVPVFVDMRDVAFFDSTTLGVFLDAARTAKAKGTTFRLINLTERARRLLEVTGTVELLTDQEAEPQS